MELFVSTVASARATAPLSFASFHHHRRAAPSSVAVAAATFRRSRSNLRTRGWRCASAAVPDPVPSEEPASSASASTVVVTEEKPDPPAEEKSEEVAAASNGGSLEVAAASLASSEAAEDGGLDDILSKLDIQVTPTYVLYGSGAFLVLWVLSSVISAIDSIPLVPKVLELIGTGYSIWFTSRYLLFKESRDELFAKFDDLKERII